MCGICGIHGSGVSEDAVGPMLEAMRRRGPDGSGRWSDRHLALGHRRLAIVDLSERGRQPMSAADGSVVVTVNGEIYNYPELRSELETEGAKFLSTATARQSFMRTSVGRSNCSLASTACLHLPFGIQRKPDFSWFVTVWE